METNGDPGTLGNLEGDLGSDDPLMGVAEGAAWMDDSSSELAASSDFVRTGVG